MAAGKDLGFARAVDLGRDDAGFGSIRPDQVVELDRNDVGIGSIRPDEGFDLDPGDVGFGSVRPHRRRQDKASSGIDPALLDAESA